MRTRSRKGAVDVAEETEALLQNLASDPVPSDPVDEPTSDAADAAPEAMQDNAEPAAASVTVSASDPTAEESTQAHVAPDSLEPGADSDGNVSGQPDSSVAMDTETLVVQAAEPVADTAAEPISDVAPVTDAVPEADLAAEPAAAQPAAAQPTSAAPVSDSGTNGAADTDGTAVANGIPAQAEPERSRSRKRRARWGAPANAPKENAADGAADGAGTGRKKRRSRWEEPAPDTEESQALTLVDTSGGSGFPHEIVLAGGIKVSMHRCMNSAGSTAHASCAELVLLLLIQEQTQC